MAKKRFLIQPAWLDFSIFWAVIVSGIALAVIIQMELVGYGLPNLVASGLLVLMLAFAGWQVHRSCLILTPTQLTIRRLLPGNTLQVPVQTLTAVVAKGHTLTLTTRDYGTITLVRLGAMAPVVDALTAVQPKGVH